MFFAPARWSDVCCNGHWGQSRRHATSLFFLRLVLPPWLCLFCSACMFHRFTLETLPTSRRMSFACLNSVCLGEPNAAFLVFLFELHKLIRYSRKRFRAKTRRYPAHARACINRTTANIAVSWVECVLVTDSDFLRDHRTQRTTGTTGTLRFRLPLPYRILSNTMIVPYPDVGPLSTFPYQVFVNLYAAINAIR